MCVVIHCRLSDQPVSSELGPEDVSVEMLMCPVNPSDINQIQGIMYL